MFAAAMLQIAPTALCFFAGSGVDLSISNPKVALLSGPIRLLSGIQPFSAFASLLQLASPMRAMRLYLHVNKQFSPDSEPILEARTRQLGGSTVP